MDLADGSKEKSLLRGMKSPGLWLQKKNFCYETPIKEREAHEMLCVLDYVMMTFKLRLIDFFEN